MKRCFSCNTELDIKGRPARADECPSCRASLKVCLNCRFHDPGAYNDCAEPQAERVVEKDRANFCEHFEFRQGGTGGDEEAAEDKDPLKELKGLFKDR